MEPLPHKGPPAVLSSSGTSLPSVFTARPQARARMLDVFSSHICNSNTRRAYMEAVRQFSAFCAEIVSWISPRWSRSTSQPSPRSRAQGS